MSLNIPNINSMLFSIESYVKWDTKQSIPHDITSNNDLFFDHQVNHFYSKPSQGGIMFGFDRIAKPFDEQYKIDVAKKMVEKMFNKTNIFDGGYWIGTMPFPLYGRPLVGSLAKLDHPDIWILNGFGPSGIAMAPMTCKLIANYIENKTKSSIVNQLLHYFNLTDNGVD